MKRHYQQKKNLPPIVYILLFLFCGGIIWVVIQLNDTNQKSVENRISAGEKVLVTSVANHQKQAGVEALASRSYENAITSFQSSLSQHRNDPEARIYWNNALIKDSRSLTIAVVVPIGSNLNVAQEILRGVAQAQDDINRNGGINGFLLRVLIANDENNPKIATEIATELVKNTQVIAVVGHNTSAASIAAAPVYQKGGLVMITPTSAAIELIGFGDYIFRALPSIRFMTDALAQRIVKYDRKTKVAVCFDALAPENASFRDAMISAVTDLGATVVNTVCDFSASDFNAIALVKRAIADGAEALVLNPHIDRFEGAIAIAKANQGKLALYASSTMYTSKTLQTAQADVNGLVLAVPWHPQFVPHNTFPQKASQLWGGQVNWRTAMAYDAAVAIITALKQSNTRAGLQKVLRAPGFSAVGALDTVKFLPSGDRLGATDLVQVQPGGEFGYEFVPLQK